MVLVILFLLDARAEFSRNCASAAAVGGTTCGALLSPWLLSLILLLLLLTEVLFVLMASGVRLGLATIQVAFVLGLLVDWAVECEILLPVL